MDLSERQGHTAIRHPWEVSRFQFFSRLVVDRLATIGQPLSILDAGSGDGWFAMELLQRLPAGSSVTCWDIHYRASEIETLEAQAPPGCHFVRCRPAGDRFDLILALDVIEHVPNDRAFLLDLVALLSPGGHVLVSVPAWNALFSSHDVALDHYRRYKPSTLRRVLAQTGLTPVVEGGLFHSLLPVRIAQKILEVLRPPTGSESHLQPWTGSQRLTRSVLRVLELDNSISRWAVARGLHLPGLSCWALCEEAS